MKLLTLYLSILLTFNLSGQCVDSIDLSSYYKDFVGGFCIYDLETDRYCQYNSNHCNRRLSPCSTFKIPNSLIGLETGVISDTGFVIKYNGLLHPKDSFLLTNEPFKHWYDDLSLHKAFKYSCVWYYQELARRVGKELMQKKVNEMDYGNKDISSGLDTYWLCGSIQISINEQVEFLRKLYLNKLPGISKKP